MHHVFGYNMILHTTMLIFIIIIIIFLFIISIILVITLRKKKLIELQVLWIDDVLDLHNALWLKGSNCSCRLLLLVAQEVPQPSNLTTCLRIICVHYVLGLLSMLGPNIVQSVQKMFRTS